jgi:hypothetical protein
VLALLGVQAVGRGQPMHAEISGDDIACMPVEPSRSSLSFVEAWGRTKRRQGECWPCQFVAI